MSLNPKSTNLGFQVFAPRFNREALAALLSFFLGKKKGERLQKPRKQRRSKAILMDFMLQRVFRIGKRPFCKSGGAQDIGEGGGNMLRLQMHSQGVSSRAGRYGRNLWSGTVSLHLEKEAVLFWANVATYLGVM